MGAGLCGLKRMFGSATASMDASTSIKISGTPPEESKEIMDTWVQGRCSCLKVDQLTYFPKEKKEKVGQV